MTDYKYLTEDYKKALQDKYLEIDIETCELSTAYYDRNPYGVEEQLIGSSGEWCCNEDEYEDAQIDKLIEWIEADGIYEYLDIPEEKSEDEKYLEDLQKEALDYLESQKSGTVWC